MKPILHRLFVHLAGLSVSAFLISCTTSGWRLPEDYDGPTASLSPRRGDTSFSRIEWFKIKRINGNDIAPYYAVPWPAPEGWHNKEPWTQPGHLVPANRPVTVTVAGKDEWDSVGAGEGAWFVDSVTLVGSVFDRPGKRVEGDLVFTPKAGGAYAVTGKLGREGSSMWIEDERAGRRVGNQVASTP